MLKVTLRQRKTKTGNYHGQKKLKFSTKQMVLPSILRYPVLLTRYSHKNYPPSWNSLCGNQLDDEKSEFLRSTQRLKRLITHIPRVNILILLWANLIEGLPTDFPSCLITVRSRARHREITFQFPYTKAWRAILNEHLLTGQRPGRRRRRRIKAVNSAYKWYL